MKSCIIFFTKFVYSYSGGLSLGRGRYEKSIRLEMQFILIVISKKMQQSILIKSEIRRPENHIPIKPM